MTTEHHARRRATTHRPSARERLTTVRDDLRSHREARLARRTLERELATYRSPADVADLLALVEGSDGSDQEAIRSILIANLRSAGSPRGQVA